MQTHPVEHYENFPVASWLCPPRLRPAVAAIYHYARTADDIADEGDAPPAQRLADLAEYRTDLQQLLSSGQSTSRRWSRVFVPLAQVVVAHDLPGQPLHDLLSAFEQDVRYTAQGLRYHNQDELLTYCRLSANPIGRLLLHLYGIGDEAAYTWSDAICSALQLINFWQDLSVDLPRQRHYLPLDDLQRFGVEEAALLRPLTPEVETNEQHAQAMLRELVHQARTLMQQGAPLVWRLPGRMGWELRLVVQGGLRILDKIEQMNYRSWRQRPRLNTLDAPMVLGKALLMRRAYTRGKNAHA